MVRPEQSYELGPDAPHRYGLPSWARAKETARAAAPEGAPAPPGGQAGPQPLLALGLVGQAGRQGLDLAAQPIDPVEGGPVGPQHLLLVLGGDQGVVDAVGAEQLPEGRRRPTGVDRPQPPAEQPLGGTQLAAGRLHLAAGSGPARRASGPGPRGPRCSPRPGSRTGRACGRWPPGPGPPWPAGG